MLELEKAVLDRGKKSVAASEKYADMQGAVVSMMRAGCAPSDIDCSLLLPDGMAREIMVAHWYKDRKKRGRR